jgi:hypothetical protein
MAADAELLVIFGMLHLIGILLAAALFMMLLRVDSAAPPPPPADGEDGGGGEGRGPQPPAPPPRGGLGIPLAHSLPARARLREPARLADLLPGPARRPVRHPEPRRAPAPRR